MDLTPKKVIKDLLTKYGTAPLKRFGQNFLTDRSILEKIIEAANLKTSDIVLEIGPGIGTLTQELAEKVGRVIAVEKDQKIVEILKETLRDFKNVEIIQADILKINLKPYTLNLKPYKVVANLPYYIVSPVIRKFLEFTETRPLQMILMVQKEVAQRICASPPTKNLVGGKPKMNLLAVSVQFYSKPEILFYVPKESFWPKPKVDGAILKITPLTNTNRRLINTKLFFKIVRAGFSQPRKQLANNLSNKLKLKKERVKKWLLENGIQPRQRAETLKLEDWRNLTKTYPSVL